MRISQNKFSKTNLTPLGKEPSLDAYDHKGLIQVAFGCHSKSHRELHKIMLSGVWK